MTGEIEREDAARSAGNDAEAPRIVIVSGSPTDEEMAAVTAVLSGVLEELAELNGSRRLTGPTAWERSQRGLRRPLLTGGGAWQTFGQ